jgi:hypothetical protein
MSDVSLPSCWYFMCGTKLLYDIQWHDIHTEFHKQSAIVCNNDTNMWIWRDRRTDTGSHRGDNFEESIREIPNAIYHTTITVLMTLKHALSLNTHGLRVLLNFIASQTVGHHHHHHHSSRGLQPTSRLQGVAELSRII